MTHMSQEPKKVDRRNFIYAGLGAVALIATGAALYFAMQPRGGGVTTTTYITTTTIASPTTTTPSKKIEIDFLMWAFDTPLQEQNATEFAKAYKRDTGIDTVVKLTSIPYDAYKASIISRMTAKTKTDVLYVEDNWFSLWEKAGWIVPIEEYRPEFRKRYESDLIPGVLDALTSRIHPGKLIGLPYYVDTLTFMYNKKMLEQAGIAEPPKTWDEVLTQAEQIKRKVGIEYPIAFAWKLGEWTFEESTFAMMYSRGGTFLNPDGTANLEKGSPLHQVLKWIKEGIDRKVIDPKSTDMVCENVQDGFKARLYAFTILPSYFLFFINTSKAPGAGEVINAMMPGTGDTTELVRFYAMTSQVPERGDEYIDACMNFIEWEGGMYDRMGTGTKVYIKPREFALRDGLPFGLKGLFDDPAIKNSMQGWIDPEIAKAQSSKTHYIEAKWATYWEDWRALYEKEVHNVIFGASTPDDAILKIKDGWNKLAKG